MSLLRGWARAALGRSGLLHAAAVLLYGLGSFTVYQPIRGDEYYYGNIDGLLILYTLEWERYAIFAEPWRLFDGLGFHQLGQSLFFTHLVLGALPVYAPLAALWGPGPGYAALVFLTPVLNGVAMYLAVWTLLRGWWAAFIAGLVMAFSPLMMNFSQFAHLATVWWTPLALAFLFSAYRRPRWWKVAASAFCVYAQFATSVYPGFFAAFVFAVFVLSGMAGGRLPWRDKRFVAWSVGGCLVAALPFLPILKGYIEFGLDSGAVRSEAEAYGLAAHLPHYIPWAAQGGRWYAALQGKEWAEQLLRWAFPGMAPVVLAVAGIVLGALHGGRRSLTLAAGTVFVGGFVLTLGPELIWDVEGAGPTGFPLPYAAAYKLIPGFAALRNPTFFAVGMMIGAALLCGLAVDGTQCWLGRRKWWGSGVAVTMTALLVAEFARFPMGAGSLPDERELQAAMKELPAAPAAFLPAGSGFGSPEPLMQRIWWSLSGSRAPILGGYSGYEPPGDPYLRAMIDRAGLEDRAKVVEALGALGVSTYVFDRQRMNGVLIENWERAIAASAAGTRVVDTGRFRLIYADRAPPTIARSWRDVRVGIPMAAAVPGATLRLPVELKNPGDIAWMPPPGRRARKGLLVWRDVGGAATLETEVTFRPPPVIVPRGLTTALTPLRARAPSQPGHYELSLVVDGMVIANTEVKVAEYSRGGVRGVNGAALLTGWSEICARSGDWVVLHVLARNVGSAPWGGGHRLGYVWAPDGDFFVVDDLEKLNGRIFLPFDARDLDWTEVATGSSYIFNGAIRAPKTPGAYSLKVGMVEEMVGWFGEVFMTVKVLPSESEASEC